MYTLSESQWHDFVTWTYISLLDLDNLTALHSSQVDIVFLKLLNGGGRDRVPWRVVSVCIWRCVCLGLQYCFIFIPNLCSFWCMLLRILKSLWFSHLIMKFPGFNWTMWVRCIVLQGACSKSAIENIVVSRRIDGLHTLEVLLSLVRHIYLCQDLSEPCRYGGFWPSFCWILRLPYYACLYCSNLTGFHVDMLANNLQRIWV